MLETFEGSVLAAADENGCLDLNDACLLLNGHQAFLTDYLQDTGDHQLTAAGLLAWLGY